MQRFLILIGILFLLSGFLWPLIERLGLGNLPGDINYRRGNFTFHFPITTMVVLSFAITALVNVIFRMFR